MVLSSSRHSRATAAQLFFLRVCKIFRNLGWEGPVSAPCPGEHKPQVPGMNCAVFRATTLNQRLDHSARSSIKGTQKNNGCARHDEEEAIHAIEPLCDFVSRLCARENSQAPAGKQSLEKLWPIKARLILLRGR